MYDPLPRGQRPTWARAGVAALSVGAIVTFGSFIVANRADPTAVPTTTTAVPTTTQAPPQAEHPLTVGSWDLVLGDDFSSGGLDQETWATCYWWDDSGCTIATTEELQWYLPENVAVSDGVLTLSAIREDTEGGDGLRYPFSSGMVSTGPASYQGTAGFAFTYGYVEMRARVPSGNGLWPSFWMLPIDFESKPEIDIMQVLGYDPTRLRVHVHTVDATGAVESQGFGSIGLDLAEDWHVYGLWWTDDEIVWYLDGAEVWRFGGADVPSEPMYLVANLAVGGDYAGPPDPATVFPAIYQIDFIRIWQEA